MYICDTSENIHTNYCTLRAHCTHTLASCSGYVGVYTFPTHYTYNFHNTLLVLCYSGAFTSKTLFQLLFCSFARQEILLIWVKSITSTVYLASFPGFPSSFPSLATRGKRRKAACLGMRLQLSTTLSFTKSIIVDITLSSSLAKCFVFLQIYIIFPHMLCADS